jgi:hypothetical protein
LCTTVFAKTDSSVNVVEKDRRFHIPKTYSAETSWILGQGESAQFVPNQPLLLGSPIVLNGLSISKDGYSLKVKHTGSYEVLAVLNLVNVASIPNLNATLQVSSNKGSSWSNLASAPITTDSSGSAFIVHLNKNNLLRIVLTGTFVSISAPLNSEVLHFRINSFIRIIPTSP